MKRRSLRLLLLLMAVVLVLPALGSGAGYAQGDARTFPETGKSVKGRFLQYWQSNGGLAQQGYPISEEMQEKSEIDGKTYTVQYFERAVFEAHPENDAPYDVLLTLLGTLAYKEKYPDGGPGGVVRLPQANHQRQCSATHDDSDSDSGLGFAPAAPQRETVGKGHLLTGMVLSSADCSPIAGAKLEMRPEVGGEHPEAQRATLYTDAAGRYRFESEHPEHIHIQVSAHGFKRIVTNLYHPAPDQAMGTFDIALAPDPACRHFEETGQALCGSFLDYWEKHGGLPQQGYPISGEFLERSELDEKQYRVQYFERAVFEAHPENAAPYDVLLSQLGTLRYRQKYATGSSGTGAGTLKATASMSVGRCCHTATLLPNGKVLVAGGFEQEGELQASAELYDPAAGKFSPTGSMTIARVGHSATLLKNGKVLLVGGFGDSGQLASAEIYDPATGKFSPTGSMNDRRGGFTATLLKDGRVLIAGGNDGTWLASAEIYDPATGRFTSTGSMSTVRAAHAAALLGNGKVLVTGGDTGRSTVLASAEVYDPATGRFSAAGNMAAMRHKHAATSLADGSVLVVGGSDARDWTGRYKSVEVYDTSAGKFAAKGNMSVARFKLSDATALLPDGRLLVAGGGESVEVYDPAKGTFSTAEGQMDAWRMYQTATTLPNGSVLIVGGYDDKIVGTAQAWVWRP
ncbi:MAG TPA: kelch repeat-containing protein [Chloroflexia bacterium]|nr:kelch repeat-containing protein [Chloroflexia bacterium]